MRYSPPYMRQRFSRAQIFRLGIKIVLVPQIVEVTFHSHPEAEGVSLVRRGETLLEGSLECLGANHLPGGSKHGVSLE